MPLMQESNFVAACNDPVTAFQANLQANRFLAELRRSLRAAGWKYVKRFARLREELEGLGSEVCTRSVIPREGSK